MSNQKDDENTLRGSDLALIAKHREEQLKNRGIIKDDYLEDLPTALPKKNAGIEKKTTAHSIRQRVLIIISSILKLKTNDSVWRWVFIGLFASVLGGLILLFFQKIINYYY